MSNKNIILDYFKKNKGAKVCDECLSVVTKIEPKSAVTSLIKKELEDKFDREKANCSLCGKLRVCNVLKEGAKADTKAEIKVVAKTETKKVEKTVEKVPAKKEVKAETKKATKKTGKLVNNFKTALELMKARYEAYTIGDIEFILSTHDPETVGTLDVEETEKWATESEWTGLEILESRDGEATDSEGTVEFIAKFKNDGMEQFHHEKSKFIKKDGVWFYTENMPINKTIVKGKKVGVNEPCPCGSGKKYKKCCGKK